MTEQLINIYHEGDKVEIREDCLFNINVGYKSAIGKVGYIHYIEPVSNRFLVNDIGEAQGRLGWYSFEQLKFIEKGEEVDMSMLKNYSTPTPIVPSVGRYGLSWNLDPLSWKDQPDRKKMSKKRRILIDEIIKWTVKTQPFEAYEFELNRTVGGNEISRTICLEGILVCPNGGLDEIFLRKIESCTFEQLLKVYRYIIEYWCEYRKNFNE